MYQKYIKRLLDLIFSALLLVLTSPVMLVTMILVRKKLGSPVFFTQERTGYRNQLFTMKKFRSMTSETDAEGNLLPDEVRLTSFGKMLRATSLDELPELLNIFKGDMSFVGPRPLLPKYVTLYSPRQMRRHDVRPGLTGLAQANGRNAIAWEEKFEFDLEYAEHISFALDFKILVKTALKVVKKEDINAGEGVTMEAFRGTKKQRFGSKRKKVVRILFASAGNKVELIQTFLYAAGNLGIRLETYATDISLGLPAMLNVQHPIRICAPQEQGYGEQMLEICRREKIDLLIPLSEQDRVLTQYNRQLLLEGTRLLMSDKNTTELCMDKQKVIAYFASCGLHMMQPVDDIHDYDQAYPAAIELRDETKGIFSYRVENEKELRYYTERFEHYLIRPFVIGTEYEVDIYCDLEGNPIYITPKRRESVQENENSRFRVVQDEMMILEVKALIEKLKPHGPLTIGIVKQEQTGYNYFVSMRPVFSDNVPVSIKAGADSPQAILKMLHGTAVGYQHMAADDGVIFSRVEQSIQIRTKAPLYTIHDYAELYDLDDEIEAVVFDLDDVLYSQKDYVRSGLRQIAADLSKVHNCYNRMCAALEKGQLPVETILKEEGMQTPEKVRECLDILVEHSPDIRLYPGVPELFRELRRKKKYIAVITDGKPVMQNQKIDALKLRPLVDEILITDELAGNADAHVFRKPNDLAYLIMRRRLGVALRNMAYVGIDPERNFAAPQKLGMRCYMYVNKDSLYAKVGETEDAVKQQATDL